MTSPTESLRYSLPAKRLVQLTRTYREEVLDLYLFDTIAEVGAITEARPEEYTTIRLHESLGGLTPYRYAAKVGA